MSAVAGAVDSKRTPSGLLVAWRAAERRCALATAGSDEATALHAEMRRLIDEYEWTVPGQRVVRRPEGSVGGR